MNMVKPPNSCAPSKIPTFKAEPRRTARRTWKVLLRVCPTLLLPNAGELMVLCDSLLSHQRNIPAYYPSEGRHASCSLPDAWLLEMKLHMQVAPPGNRVLSTSGAVFVSPELLDWKGVPQCSCMA